MIYTLDFLKKEAELIAGHWNGESERYTDGNGDIRTEEEAQAASELMETLKQVEELVKELGI